MVLNWLEKEGAGGAGRLSRVLRGRFSCMPAQVRHCTPVRRSGFIQFILHSHEIFPSLFSFYFKIWVFVFESVTFCLFRVSFALREIHTGALGIGYLLHSFLHSGKWTSAATLWWFALWLKPCGGQKCLTLLHPPPLAPIFSSLSLFQESKRYQSPCLHLHVTYPQKQSEESGWCGFQIKNLPRVCRLRVSVSPAPPR